MSATRIVAGLMFVTILCSTFMLSQASDLAILQRVGHVTSEQVRGGLPRLQSPLASFHAGDALPIEERVRMRIHTDKDLEGAEVTAHATETAGQITLKGIITSARQKARAIELAERTAGVTCVIDEMAMLVSK